MNGDTHTHEGRDRDAYDPRDALADVADSRSAVADRLVTPWWYHPILGGLLAVLVLVNAIELPTVPALMIVILCAVGMGALAGAYKKLTGLWVDLRNTGPRSRAWWLGYAAIVAAAVIVPLALDVRLSAWGGLLLAAAVFVITVILGRKIDSALREEIRSGAAPLPARA